MADPKVKSFEFNPIERQWVVAALSTQRNVLVRSRSKEIVGGEVHELRGREIAQVDQLLAKVSG